MDDGAEERRLGSRRSRVREDRRQRSERKKTRRRTLYSIVGGIVGLALIAGLFIPQLGSITGRNTGTQRAPEIERNVGTEAAIQEGGVIETDEPHAPYVTNPPASGPRLAEPAGWGTFDAQQLDEQVLQNLYRGGIAVNHNISDEARLAELVDIVENQPGYPGCFVVQPYLTVPAGSVTLTAWGWFQQFDELDRVGMQAFINAHKNQAPEFHDSLCGLTAAGG